MDLPVWPHVWLDAKNELLPNQAQDCFHTPNVFYWLFFLNVIL